MVAYIHRNPIHHAYGQDLGSYPWSSDQLLQGRSASWLARETVMGQFGGEQAYVAYHQHKVEAWAETQALMIEE